MIQNTANCASANNTNISELINNFHNTIKSLSRLLIAIIILETDKKITNNNVPIKTLNKNMLIMLQNLYNKIVSCPIEINICRNLEDKLVGMILNCKCNKNQTLIDIKHSLLDQYKNKFSQDTIKIKNIYNLNKIDLNKYSDVVNFFINIIQYYRTASKNN